MERINDQPSWWIFRNIYICKLGGLYDISVLKVNPSLTANILILYETLTHDKNDPLKLRPKKNKDVTYNYISDIIHGGHYNVFAVVANILKPETILANSSKHTMLTLIDPLCLEVNAKIKELPLHIFINKHDKNITHPFEVGNIVRIRNLYVSILHSCYSFNLLIS